MPQDPLYKKFFDDVSVVKDFLQIYMPQMVRETCNFNTLTISSGTFVEKDLHDQCSDRLYSMNTSEGAGYVYFLIEHQSSRDEMIMFRLLRYSLVAMHRHIKQGND